MFSLPITFKYLFKLLSLNLNIYLPTLIQFFYNRIYTILTHYYKEFIYQLIQNILLISLMYFKCFFIYFYISFDLQFTDFESNILIVRYPI